MWAEARSLVAIGLLAAVMLRVCLRVGAGSGDSAALLGVFDVVDVSAVAALVVTLAGVVGDCGMAACCWLVGCCGLVGAGDVSGLAAAAGSPPGLGAGSAACCLWGPLMQVDGSVFAAAAGSPPEVGAGSSSSLSDSYAAGWVVGG